MLLLTLCACAAPAPSHTTATPIPTPTSTSDSLSGTFDVGGGRRLYLDCEGAADGPTIVYFHGYIDSPEAGGSRNGAGLQGQMADRSRFCVYDRANVGNSDPLPGPLTAAGSAHDAHALLDAAGIAPPYVLLGASFGGLVAFTFAGTYPREVAGALFLDPVVLNELESDQFVPEEFRLVPGLWQTATEQTDRIQSYADASAVAATVPAVPATLLATSTLDLPPRSDVVELTASIRQGQAEFIGHFSPGVIQTVDSDHCMEAAIPDRVVTELDHVLSEVG
jgi:pimeloyl-ACP methyl ester carboxylesterase